MCITGHETDAMFRTYNITSEADLRDAMQKALREFALGIEAFKAICPPRTTPSRPPVRLRRVRP
jgi:hypothetical protein